MSINRVILLGNVGADPEIRSTQTGDKIATFRIATSETWKDKNTGERKEQTEWHTIVVFNQAIVKVVENYVHKGSKVGVEGSLATRKWTDRNNVERYSTEILIKNFDGKLTLESPPKDSARDPSSYGTTRTRDDGPSKPAQSSTRGELDDEAPF
jgi:single-strand DNA-binding protein